MTSRYGVFYPMGRCAFLVARAMDNPRIRRAGRQAKCLTTDPSSVAVLWRVDGHESRNAGRIPTREIRENFRFNRKLG